MNVYDILLAKKFAGGGGITPTGNINITDTAVTDVAAYATAQVVDGNLVAGNIKKDIDILGVTGSYEGSGGGGAQPQRDVNFIDYDGTILHSYTAAEFADLTAMPNNPDHSSDIQWGGHTIPLTSQGWNYTLADAKAYVAAYGKLWIGQMYKPTDGKLHLCVRMDEGRLNPASRFKFTGAFATIDWGDGTLTNAVSDADNEHTYAAAGDYDVTIEVSDGETLDIAGDSTSGCLLFQKPNNTTINNEHVYHNCLIKAFIPDSVESIGDYAFYYCYSLQNVTIHDGVTSIGASAFCSCYELQNVTISSSITRIYENAFRGCYTLRSVAIPYTVTSVGNSLFYACHALQSIAFPNSSGFFRDSMFQNCYSLQNVTIPHLVTTINDSVFNGCYGLGFIRFKRSTPPTVPNSNAWKNIPTDCIIYVPAASLETYKSKTNYPSPSTYTYIGY